MKRLCLVWLAGILSTTIFSQSVPGKNYPRGYFQWPVGLKKEIVANMGELRPNHWHMGLDIRTNQQENQPVNASAAGYISHIGIRPQSFGRFIVITHPNGLSTLYGHLNDFYPALEEYVTRQQYQQESWAIELDFTSNQFPVTKGQFIALSGNTGGSQGPHVHFEIFDTKTTKRLNPLLFGFDLDDHTPPTMVKLALYDRSLSVYEQTPQFIAVKNTDSGYILPKIPVLKTCLRKISFGLQVYDRMDGSANADGVYSALLSIDQHPVVRFAIDSISYDETAYMNAQIDYRYRYNGGAFVQHLSKLPGDHGPVYHHINGDGVINLDDTIARQVTIDVRDAANNISQLSFLLQYSDSLATVTAHPVAELPLAPNTTENFTKNDFAVSLGTGCLYDTIHPVYFRRSSSGAYAVSALHQLNDASSPLHDDMRVRIKPDRSIPEDWKNRLVMQRSSRGSSVRKASWENGWLAASFGDFGTYQVFADILPPSINDLGKSDTINLSAATRIMFTPADNFGIKGFRAELDSQWIRFTNDKSRNWIYVFDERCPYGVHQLQVTVEDIVGNKTTRTWWFKKIPYTPPVKKKYSSKKKSSKKATTKKKTSTVKKTTTRKKK